MWTCSKLFQFQLQGEALSDSDTAMAISTSSCWHQKRNGFNCRLGRFLQNLASRLLSATPAIEKWRNAHDLQCSFFWKLFCENSHPFWCYMSPQYSSSLLDPRDRFVVVFSAPLHPKNVLLRPSIRIGILWLRWHRPILFHNRRPHLLPRNRRSFHDWSPCNDRTRPSCEIYDCWQLLEECMVICSSPNT